MLYLTHMTNIFYQYHSIYNFKRSNDNKILSKTFHYLDSLGKKIDDLIPEKWNYVYSDNNLIKVKKLDENGIEHIDDEKCIYCCDTDDEEEEFRHKLYKDDLALNKDPLPLRKVLSSELRDSIKVYGKDKFKGFN